MPSVFIPAHVRGIIYSIYALVGLGLGATQVGFSAADAGQPVWLTVALSVFAFVGTGIGYTAASNTPAAPSEQRPILGKAFRGDGGYAAALGAVALMLLGVLALLAVYLLTRDLSAPQAILGKAILGKA